jgi:hypothetical protein
MSNASAWRVLEASARVFGHAMPQNGPSGLKLLKQPLIGHRVAAYYPEFRVQQFDPLFESHHEARRKVCSLQTCHWSNMLTWQQF